ncbi:MAG: helix-turn-helix domain-containing protein [Candidatus Binataceae bacterium]
MAIDNPLSPVITVRGLAEYLQVHPSTVYRLVKLGLLPAFKVGSDWRFNREDIQRWRLAQTSQSLALAGIPAAQGGRSGGDL